MDIDELLRNELQQTPTATAPAAANWRDVLVRAGEARRRRNQRLLAITIATSAALTLAASPLGGAIARSVGDFSSWLQGTPGEPASNEEQRAFEEANRRSWIGFPDSPKLRQLITLDQDGVTYRLFGFRSGNSLCLRIRAEGAAPGATMRCAPVNDLENDEAPVRVLLADWSVGRGTKTRTIGFDTFTAPYAQVTAGIAADGVSAVELRDDTGVHRVAPESNAFLYVAERPEVAQQVSAVVAHTAAGSMPVPFSPIPRGFSGGGSSGSGGKPGGPTQVERRLRGGRVGWLDRRAEVGEPITVIPERSRAHMKIEFGRVLTPDPQSPKRMLVMIGRSGLAGLPGRPRPEPTSVCYYLVVGGAAGGGCSSFDKLFPDVPFTFGYSSVGAGTQYGTFSGITSDDVARMELYTATGNKLDVPLRDNAFLLDVALARLPAKLVAYDSDGRVIGIRETPPDEGPATIVGQPLVDRELVLDGGTAAFRAYRTKEGGGCWFLRARGPFRVNMGGCAPADWQKAPVRVSPQGNPPVLYVGRARQDIERVVFRFATGEEAEVRPGEHGYVFERVDPPLKARSGDLTEIIGYDAAGKEVQHQRVRRRP